MELACFFNVRGALKGSQGREISKEESGRRNIIVDNMRSGNVWE
jgi:hypothetical protein